MDRIRRNVADAVAAARPTKSGVTWVGAAESRSAAVSLLGAAALAYSMSPVAFGQYQYAAAAAGLFSAFALTGAHSALSRAVAVGKEGTLRVAFRGLLLSHLPAAVVSAGIAAYYASHGDPTLSIAFAAIAVTTPLANSAATFNSYLQGLGDFRRIATLGNVTTTLPIAAAILAALAGANPGWVILASLATKTTLNLACYFMIVRETRAGGPVDENFWRNAAHGSAQGAIGTVAGRLDSVVVFQVLGAAELAGFAVATSIADRATSIVRAFAQVLFPRLAEKTQNEALGAVRRHAWAVWASSAVAAAGAAIAAPVIVFVMFPGYADFAWHASVYAGISLLAVSGALPVTAFSAQQRHRSLYASTAIAGTVGVLGVYALGRSFGVLGAVVGRAAGKLSGATFAWLETKIPKNQRPATEIETGM